MPQLLPREPISTPCRGMAQPTHFKMHISPRSLPLAPVILIISSIFTGCRRLPPFMTLFSMTFSSLISRILFRRADRCSLMCMVFMMPIHIIQVGVLANSSSAISSIWWSWLMLSFPLSFLALSFLPSSFVSLRSFPQRSHSRCRLQS